MAKCTDKERELIDSILRNEYSHDLIKEVVIERITKDMRNRLRSAYKKYFEASTELGNVRSEFYAICADKNMAQIMSEIESEVNDLK